MNQQPQLNPQMLKEHGKTVFCEECDSDMFDVVFRLKTLSKLVTGTPTDAVIPMQLFKCAKCGAILPLTDPENDQ